MITRNDRIAGGLWGALVGDALGVPYEFKPASGIPALADIEMEPPAGFARSHGRVPPGTWSDDGSQALCLLASLLERDTLDLEDFSGRMVNWYERGYMAVDGRIFDVGIQTSSALAAISRGTPISEAGRADEQGNGNGALMRVVPLALWHRGSDEALVADAHAQCIPTHPHPRSQVCCAIYCLWARYELAAVPDAFVRAVATVRALYPADSPHAEELEFHVRPEASTLPGGSGYVVDTLRGAQHLMQLHSSYEDVVRGAIALGRDTDTTACVAGGIAGIRWGVQGIPARWRSAMRGVDLVDPLLAALS